LGKLGNFSSTVATLLLEEDGVTFVNNLFVSSGNFIIVICV